MRALKQYAGVILMLITAGILAGSFYTDALMDADMNHTILGVCLVLVVLSIILTIVGGKSADKIGGK